MSYMESSKKCFFLIQIKPNANSTWKTLIADFHLCSWLSSWSHQSFRCRPLFGTLPVSADYVSSCVISLNISNKGLATCISNIVLRRGVNAEMTVTLYKSTNKRNWDYVTSWDTSGSSSLVLEKSYYVMSGYYYKAELSADVYNSSGSFLENVTSTSSIKYYWSSSYPCLPQRG